MWSVISVFSPVAMTYAEDRWLHVVCGCAEERWLVSWSHYVLLSCVMQEGVQATEDLNNMQCMWYLTETARAYQRLGRWGDALKKCHEVDRVSGRELSFTLIFLRNTNAVKKSHAECLH